MAPAGQLSMQKFELQMPNPDKPEITNDKHQIIYPVKLLLKE
jgi:hypothetical protein